MTALVLWLSVSAEWLSPAVTVSTGPAIYWSRPVNTHVYTEDALSIEPANLSYEIVSRELGLESRLDAYLVLPPSR